jgi:hypothetical protein
MNEAERVKATATVAGVTLTPERAQAAAELVKAMEYADRALLALDLTHVPSGPDPAP